MPLESFFVVRHGSVWRIKHAGKDSRAFHSELAAITEAIDLARVKVRAGGRAQVLVQNAEGTFRTAWSSGRDPRLKTRKL
jgi:hypothetical protein